MNDGRDFADFEQAWTNLDSVARMFRMRPMNMDGGKVHPTQKPVRLIEWCLALIGEAKTICDPFGGSFTTAVACIRTGRQFIGCELEERYCEIGAKRCDRELNQGRLPFAPPEPPAVQREMFE
jgi:DNA modification methylase